MKILINENQYRQIFQKNQMVSEQAYIREEYPLSFNMSEFKNITGFKDKINYCESHLQRIGVGSSRIVYLIDDSKVLKLAKNNKGLVQNRTEVDYSRKNNDIDIFAQVYQYDKDYQWLEMELAKTLTDSDFKKIKGYSFKDFSDLLLYNKLGYNLRQLFPQDKLDVIQNDNFYKNIVDYMLQNDIPSGDLRQINSYGVVGIDNIVLIDYGITTTVYNKNY